MGLTSQFPEEMGGPPSRGQAPPFKPAARNHGKARGRRPQARRRKTIIGCYKGVRGREAGGLEALCAGRQPVLGLGGIAFKFVERVVVAVMQDVIERLAQQVIHERPVLSDGDERRGTAGIELEKSLALAVGAMRRGGDV